MATHPTAKSTERLRLELLLSALDAGFDLEDDLHDVNYEEPEQVLPLPNVVLGEAIFSSAELRFIADWLDANATPEPAPRAPQHPAKPT